MLDAEQRTVSNFAEIIGSLKERLHRWTRAGQYGFLFDNVAGHAQLQPLPDLQFPWME